MPGTGVPVGTFDSNTGDGALGVPTKAASVLADEVTAESVELTELAALEVAS